MERCLNSSFLTPNPESQRRPLKLAIVDDDPSVRRALARLLRSIGYDVQVFASGGEFLLHGLDEPLDCLIIDVRMPGQTGMAFADVLTTAGFQVPMILITGDVDATLAERAERSGVVQLLSKPVDEAVIRRRSPKP